MPSSADRPATRILAIAGTGQNGATLLSRMLGELPNVDSWDARLFGRYWGASADFHSLHFETCYHQGIEYCIERGLTRFESGAQGEHKVARGFAPATTWSMHWIVDPRFREAIADYLRREGEDREDYARYIGEHVPYRKDPRTKMRS